MTNQERIDSVKQEQQQAMNQRAQVIQLKAELEARLNYLQGKLDLLTDLEGEASEPTELPKES